MTLSMSGYVGRSFRFYFRPNIALAFAVAAATAVLIGGLVVGSSMRGSLRELTLERLAGVDEILVGDHFFGQQLVDSIRASDVFQKNYRTVVPVIFFPNGTVESKQHELTHQSSNVNVLGVDDALWELQGSINPEVFQSWLADDQVVINQALADELMITEADVSQRSARLTVRIPRPTVMPADSALGEKEELVERLVDLRVAGIIENRQLGRFSIEPSQQVPRNIFLSLSMLQELLARKNPWLANQSAVVNAAFLVGRNPDQVLDTEVSQKLRESIAPSPFDLGLKVERVQLAIGKEDESTPVHEYVNVSTARLVFSPEQAAAIETRLSAADPVSTYLVNRLRITKGIDPQLAVPYSMVSAVEFGRSFRPVSAVNEQLIATPGDNEIVLNEWAAKDLGAQVGDVLEVEFFEPESTHGVQRVQVVRLKLVDIARLTIPNAPFVYRRRELVPAIFTERPEMSNDWHMTPEVPGLSDSESIENWDLPFKLEYTIRPQDDEYWNYHRTTPKGFVNLDTAKKLWNSRFGWKTGYRLDATVQLKEVEKVLLEAWRANPSLFGLDIFPVKRVGLAAASGTTPFDALFLGLSLFIITSALLLVSILFRLGIEQRVEQIGVMTALGFTGRRIAKLWLGEASLVCALGGSLGVGLGVLYGAVIIQALRTLWVGAIATPFLSLHVTPVSLLVGLICGFVTSLITIAWLVRQFVNEAPIELLAGSARVDRFLVQAGDRGRWLIWLGFAGLVLAIGLTFVAARLGGEAQAGAFLGGGGLVLVSQWLLIYRALKRTPLRPVGKLGIGRLSLENLRRNPVRSILIIGLVSVAAFIIISISSFRLQPTERSTGGARWIARSSVPLLKNLNSLEGQRELLGDVSLPKGCEIFSLRLKPGQDASCNNLFQSTQPRVLGLPQDWIDRFDSDSMTNFLWSSHLAGNDFERRNPWRLLTREPSGGHWPNSAVPAVLDKNTAMYSLKIYSVGTEFTVKYDSGQQVTFRVVGFLENSIFQGSVLVSEPDFVRIFPEVGGYREFLVTGPDDPVTEKAVLTLENPLRDFGFDVIRSRDILSQFASVQNTYLSAFQSLGGLGMLLGTLGLAAVQLRSIWERRKELALMRALGFSPRRLVHLLFCEQMVLLAAGLAVGVLAAFFTTIPHFFTGNAALPFDSLFWILSTVVAFGALAGVLSARRVLKLPLTGTLRGL